MLEQNKVYNLDCLEGLKLLDDNSIDSIVTDPPYKMTKRGKSCRPNWMPNNMGENVFGDLPIPDTYTWMKECFRVLKDESHFYTFTSINDIQNFLTQATLCGFKLHNIISMIKDTGMPNRWYYKQTELVLFFRKGKAKPINDFTSRDNIKVIMPKQKDGKLHITQKPLDFIEKLITNSSTENQIILDPFMGSGTTAVACINTNRNYIGFEMDENYYNICQKRLEEAKNNK